VVSFYEEARAGFIPGVGDSRWRNYFGRFGVPGRLALITPALFSPPPPLPDGRRGRKAKPLFLSPSLPSGGGEAGREGLGSEGQPPKGRQTPAGNLPAASVWILCARAQRRAYFPGTGSTTAMRVP